MWSLHITELFWIWNSPLDLPDSGIKPGSPTLQADSLPFEPQEKPPLCYMGLKIWKPTRCCEDREICEEPHSVASALINTSPRPWSLPKDLLPYTWQVSLPAASLQAALHFESVFPSWKGPEIISESTTFIMTPVPSLPGSSLCIRFSREPPRLLGKTRPLPPATPTHLFLTTPSSTHTQGSHCPVLWACSCHDYPLSRCPPPRHSESADGQDYLPSQELSRSLEGGPDTPTPRDDRAWRKAFNNTERPLL